MTPPGLIDAGPRGGTPLVLLHGFLGCAEDWRRVIEDLSTTRRCVAFDLPGHGRTPEPIAPGPRSFEDAVERVAAHVEGLGLGPFDLLGYSMGGRLVYGLVAEVAERVRRAVVVGGSPGLDDEIERRTRKRTDDLRARALEREPFEAWLDRWYAQPLFDPLRSTPGYAALRARRLTGQPQSLALALRALSPGVQPPLRHRLKRGSIPLLLVAGALDPKYAALNRSLAQDCPTIRDVLVAEAGHAPHLETPDAFIAAVRGFLEGP